MLLGVLDVGSNSVHLLVDFVRSSLEVAEATMDLFDADRMVNCPWAPREGIILRRLDGLET